MAHFCAKRQKGKCLWDGGENYLAPPKSQDCEARPCTRKRTVYQCGSGKRCRGLRSWRFAVVAV
ncbi:MAG: hypothetical protein JXR76_21280, partial [Deltaproteobacteria bacterium]|nr:hypothetical protein [Deltaproteobacteria bacterium]